MAAIETNQAVLESDQDSAVTEPVSRYVVVGVYQNLYGISTDCTVELMDSDVTQITRVPHSPKFISGVINHRGSIIPVVDTRLLLGFQTTSAESASMISMMNKFEQAHADWLSGLRQCIENDDEFTATPGDRFGAFKKWHREICASETQMQHLTRGDAQLEALIKNLGDPHMKITSISGHIGDVSSVQGKQDALKAICDVTKLEFGKMRDLFKRINEGITKVSVSMMIITELGARKAALLVDSVHTVKDVPLSSVEPLPESAENHQFLKGLVHESDGSYILITDLASIYETACPTDLSAES